MEGNFKVNFTYDSRQLTAEWIVEQPQVNNALTTLANFGNVTFTDCNANLLGKTGGVSSFAYNNVQMQPQIVNNKSVQLVFVSLLQNGGTQFTVNYVPCIVALDVFGCFSQFKHRPAFSVILAMFSKLLIVSCSFFTRQDQLLNCPAGLFILASAPRLSTS